MSLATPKNSSSRRKHIFDLVWPATAESVLHFMVGLIATAMVGRLGAISIGASGLSHRILQTVWALSQMVTVGVTVLIARSFGASLKERVGHLTYQSTLFAFVAGLFISILTFIYADPLLALFGGSSELHEAGVHFTRILIWSLPFSLLSLTVSAALRGVGDTRTGMNIALIINGISAGLGFVLIFGMGPLPPLGLKGSAIATIFAQVVGCLISLRILKNPLYPTHCLGLRSYRFCFQSIKEILTLGIPASAESLFWQASTIILTFLIVSFGDVALAAHQLGLQAEGLSYMPAVGLAIASTTLVAHSLGAKDKALAQYYVKEVMNWTLLLTLITGSALVLFPQAILRLLTDDREIIELGARYVIIMGLVQLPQQACGVWYGTFRGAGDTRTPMLIALVGIWGVRVPLAFLLSKTFGFGIFGVWYAIGIDLVIRFLLSYYFFRKGHWLITKRL